MTSVYYSAKVKAVLSADTIILVPATSATTSTSTSTPPLERQLSLAYVQAPKLSLNEVYSFQAREILRKLLIGKTVKFQVLYTLPGLGGTKREFGDIKTPIFDSLIAYLLQQGAVKLKENNSTLLDEDEELYYQLADLQSKAKADSVGLWGHQNKIDVSNELLFDDVQRSQSQAPLDAVVEKVISGDRLLVRVLLDKTRHSVLPVLIAGIKSPRSGASTAAAASAGASASAAPASASEPFGNEAKYFVEQRLLLRNVKLSIVGESANGIHIAKIIHPAGNIAEKILENGLAEVVDWQSTSVGAKDMALLRASERLAKVAQRGLWKNAAATAAATVASGNSKTAIKVGSSYEATVARVISADTIVIRIGENGDQELTVQLSSLRAPRNSDPSQAPFVPFAKEFVRKKIIGKHLQITIDGIRPKSDSFDERPLISVQLHDGSDLGELIVSQGWATVVRHRRGDDARSANWDVLIEAEKKAADKKAGLHSNKLPPSERIVDASENAGRAKTFLTTFSNRSRINAVVDYVSSANRFRLLLPKDGVKLVLVLGGLANTKGKDSALQNAALDYVTKKALQRDVQIQIYSTDKVGGFIGNLFLPGQSLPLQHSLLSQGFAEIHEFSIDQTKFSDEFWDAQEKAQQQRIGVWKNWTPADADADADVAGEEDADVADLTKATANASIAAAGGNAPAAQPKYYDIEVNDISDEGVIAFQLIDSESEKLISFMKQFHEFHNNQPIRVNAASSTSNSSSYPQELTSAPRKGDLVSVAFSKNGKFYRGKVLGYDASTRKFKVQHIDFGNVDYVTSGPKAFRKLPAQFSLDKLAPQGHTASLALVRLPPSQPTNYLDDALDFLDELIIDKKLIALENKKNPEGLGSGVEVGLTLYDPDKALKNPTLSVQRELVSNGYAIVNKGKKLKSWEKSLLGKELEELLKLEKVAKQERKGCWEHGDIEEDED